MSLKAVKIKLQLQTAAAVGPVGWPFQGLAAAALLFCKVNSSDFIVEVYSMYGLT
jgi:hypothetical protein